MTAGVGVFDAATPPPIHPVAVLHPMILLSMILHLQIFASERCNL
jgi:hypothetical protein